MTRTYSPRDRVRHTATGRCGTVSDRKWGPARGGWLVIDWDDCRPDVTRLDQVAFHTDVEPI